MPTTPQNGGIDIGFERLPLLGGILANLLFELILSSSWAVFPATRITMTGGAPEVRSDKSLTLLTFGI